MGVMLRPNEDPMPSEEELARLAGLVPGDVDRKHLDTIQQSLNEKGFMKLLGNNDRKRLP